MHCVAVGRYFTYNVEYQNIYIQREIHTQWLKLNLRYSDGPRPVLTKRIQMKFQLFVTLDIR